MGAMAAENDRMDAPVYRFFDAYCEVTPRDSKIKRCAWFLVTTSHGEDPKVNLKRYLSVEIIKYNKDQDRYESMAMEQLLGFSNTNATTVRPLDDELSRYHERLGKTETVFMSYIDPADIEDS